MAEAIFVPVGDGRAVTLGPMGGGRLLAGDEATGKTHAILEFTLNPGMPSPPHVHRLNQESVYVIDGEVEFISGDRRERGTAGAFAHVPPGVPHSLNVMGEAPARLLLVNSPAAEHLRVIAAFEKVFEGDPTDQQRMAQIFAGLDIEFLQG